MSAVAQIARMELERQRDGGKRYGIVTSWDADNHLAKVTLQPEGHELGWVTVRVNHVGNGWGMVVGLSDGDQVTLEPQAGDANTFEVTGVVHSDDDKPPRVESGEIYIRHKDGASIKFDKSGGATLTDKGGGSLSFDGAGKLTING